MNDDANTPTNTDLDLDALAPKGARIQLGGEYIEVPSLDLPDYAKLLDVSSELAKLKDTEDPEAVMPVYEKIRTMIDSIIPGLRGKKLNLAQLTAVFNLLVTVNSPTDKTMAELEKRGIGVSGGGDGDPKDESSTSSEPSVSSSEPTQPTQ